MIRFALLCALICAAASVGAAGKPPEIGRSTVNPAIMQIDESAYLGNKLRGETLLVDEEGKEFALSDFLGKPMILLLSYYGCDGTCPAMNENLAKVLMQVERFRIGQDYRVLSVSFDKQDTPQTASDFLKKSTAVPVEMKQGWRHTVLKGPENEVEGFAGSVGFKYFWSAADKTFLHPNVLVFLTPEGRVARYIYGTRMDAKAIELALTDADWDRIASSSAVFDILTGACYSFNYAEGRYQLNYSLLIGMGSLVFGLSLMGLGAWVFKKRMGEGTHA